MNEAEKFLLRPDSPALTVEALIDLATPQIDTGDKHQRQRAVEAFNALLRKGLLKKKPEGTVSIIR